MATKQIALQKIIRIGFALILLLLISNGATSFWIMQKMVETSSWVAHTAKVKEKLDMLLGSLIDAETGQRGYLYTNKEEFLEPYRKALLEIQKNHDATADLIKDNPAQVQRLKSVSDLTKQKLDEMAEVILLQNAGKKKEALDLVMTTKGKKIMDNIRAAVDEMDRVEEGLLAQRENDEKYFENLAQTFIAGGTLLAAVICIFIFLYISRNVIRKFIIPVNEAVAAISSSATQIAATITQHERTASQQASAANETSATITELSASSRQSSEQAANAAAAAERSSTATAQGSDATRQAVAAMANLKDKIAAMADQILHLGEQTGQIGSIATLLKDLGGQINMLALNAAVEAARAGEHGKGFAVVASEIRKLADQSKKSAEQTAVLVTDIQKATNSSIMMTEDGTRTVNDVTQLAQKVAELFNNLSGMAGSVNENVQQVMLNAKQQSAAFTQIVEATNNIAAGAKETAAGISQTKIGVQKLNEAAENLKAIA